MSLDFITQADAFLASLHPSLADVSTVQMFCTMVMSWLGVRAICGPREESRRTLAEVREIMAAAKRRKRK